MSEAYWPNSDLTKAFAMTDEEIEAAVAADPDDVMLTEAELATMKFITFEESMVRDAGPNWRERFRAPRKDAAA